MQKYNLDLTLTAAELHQIAADNEHYAHCYMWSDGSFTWDITDLSEEVGEEAIHGEGAESELSLSPVDLSEKGRNIFTNSFLAATLSLESTEKKRWSMPWKWDKYHDYFDKHLMPEDMGRAWAKIIMTESAL